MPKESIYSQEYIDKAEHYLKNYEEYGDTIPTHEGMADVMGVGRSTLYFWAKDEEKEMSTILSRCNAKQARRVINKSLLGDYNPTIAKLLLGKHGYSEKTDNTHSGPNGGPIETKNNWNLTGVKTD
jgi:hypothetical protein